MILEALLAEMRRNARVLDEVANATDLRIAYKTEGDWKRLRFPAEEVLRDAAIVAISERLNALHAAVMAVAVDEAFAELANELGSVKDAMFALFYGKC